MLRAMVVHSWVSINNGQINKLHGLAPGHGDAVIPIVPVIVAAPPARRKKSPISSTNSRTTRRLQQRTAIKELVSTTATRTHLTFGMLSAKPQSVQVLQASIR